jgi:hypothetical protein
MPIPTASPCFRSSPNPVWACLQRVGEGVAEVEQRPTSDLALVLGDDLGLHLHRTPHRVGQRLAVQRQHRRPMPLQPGEELQIAQQPVLDHLGVTTGQFARRQRLQHP